MIRFACPGCKKVLQVADEQAGAAVVCPQCKGQMRVPAVTARPQPVPTPQVPVQTNFAPANPPAVAAPAPSPAAPPPAATPPPPAATAQPAPTAPSASTQGPSKLPLWQQAWQEVKVTSSTTWDHSVRLVQYGRGLWQQWSHARAAREARKTLGSRLYETGAGDPQVRRQIEDMEAKIQEAAAKKQTAWTLKAEKEKLVEHLGQQALAQPHPQSGAEIDYAQAQKAQQVLQQQTATLQTARTALQPQDRLTWRRLLVGYGTVACVLLLGLIFLWGGRGRSGSLGDAVPDFSGVDYTVPKVDYTKGPKGEKIERFVDDQHPLDLIECFHDNKGEPVQHGKVVEFYEKNRKKSEQWWYNGKPHGPRFDWYENGNKEWEGAYRDGEKHGRWAYFDEQGKIAAESHWLKGQRHGIVATYYGNGKKASLGAFRGDKLTGKTQRWYEDGRVMSKDDALREDLEEAVSDQDYDRILFLMGDPDEVVHRTKVKTIKHAMYVWQVRGGKYIAVSMLDRGNGVWQPDQLRAFQVDQAKMDNLKSVWVQS